MREQLASLLHRAGALQMVMQLRRHQPVPTVSIITYHHLGEHDPHYAYDPEIIDATPTQFRAQMEALVRYCTPIGIDELLRAVEGAPLPPNPVMVTFDDGYQSCHDIALPILRAVGVRATFFIATSFITDRRLYWWERIALLVHQATHPGRLTYPRLLSLAPRSAATRRLLNDTIKDAPHLDIDRFLGDVAAALGVAWSPELEAAYAGRLIMTWDQIRALSRAGMDIESHTRTHRVLQTLDGTTLDDELAGSRRDLEAALGRPVRAIAYPVGRRLGRGTQRVRAAIHAAGYQLGLSNASGTNTILPAALQPILPLDRLDVRRLSMDRALSEAMFLGQIALPGFGYRGRHDPD